jgi:hypothetical protein
MFALKGHFSRVNRPEARGDILPDNAYEKVFTRAQLHR